MNFIDQFKRQINFIKTSCELYDSGNKEEAIRIAVTIRVLLHDTNSSTSLLTHLDKKDNISLLSTIDSAQPSESENILYEARLPLWLSIEGVKPPLHEANRKDIVQLDQWWNEIVISQSESCSRKDIILSAANQDGGAHVDENPSPKTKELKRGVGTLTVKKYGVEVVHKLTDHHFPILRQIGYEILNSPDIANLENAL